MLNQDLNDHQIVIDVPDEHDFFENLLQSLNEVDNAH